MLLAEADIGEALFSDCRADMAAFAGAQLERVHLTSCDLSGSDWQGAKLKLVTFDACDLREVDFTGTRFTSVEMLDCKLDGARGVASLRGVTMRWEDVLANAGVFAGACGVRVSS